MKVHMHIKVANKSHKTNNNLNQAKPQTNITSKHGASPLPIFRLCYVEMKEGVVGRGYPALETKYGTTSPFVVQPKMTLEQAYQVVSYVMDKVIKENDYKFASIESVEKTANLLRDYGFFQKNSKTMTTEIKKTQFSKWHTMKSCYKSEPNVHDMFVVNGNVRLFDQTDLKDKFYSWYTSTTRDQIKSIYQDIGRENVFYKAECKHSKINQRSNEKTLQK